MNEFKIPLSDRMTEAALFALEDGIQAIHAGQGGPGEVDPASVLPLEDILDQIRKQLPEN